MALSNIQQRELHKSILSYFKKHRFDAAYDAFATQTGLQPEAKHEGMLENKWRSLIALQKKIFALEAQVKQLEEEVKNAGRPRKADASALLPVEPAKHTLVGHRESVTCVTFHPVYTVVATGGEDATIKLWDYETGKVERSLKGHSDAVQGITFNGAGTLLASCSTDLSIKLWDMDSYSCVKTMHGHDHMVASVDFLPSNDMLVSCSRDKTMKMWDLTSGYCVKTYTGHEAWVRHVSVSPDGTMLATASMDKTVRIWNTRAGECIKVLRDHDHVVETIAWSNGNADTVIAKAMAAGSGAEEGKPGRPGHASRPSMALLATARQLLEGTAAELKDEKKGEESPGGKYLISGSRDRLIKIWHVETGQCIKTLDAHDNWVRAAFFHPSGRFVVSAADDKTIRVFDIEKAWRQCRKIDNAHSLFITGLAWNRTMPLMASSSVDATVKIWECR